MLFYLTAKARAQRDAAAVRLAQRVADLQALMDRAETGDEVSVVELKLGSWQDFAMSLGRNPTYSGFPALYWGKLNAGRDKLKAEKKYRGALESLEPIRNQYRAATTLEDQLRHLLYYRQRRAEQSSKLSPTCMTQEIWDRVVEALGDSLEELVAAEAELLQAYYAELLEAAPRSRTARLKLHSLIRRTTYRPEVNFREYDLYRQGVDPLTYPEGWDRWVAAQDVQPAQGDFRPRPDHKPEVGEYRVRAVASLGPDREGYDDIDRLVEAKQIIAAANAKPSIREEVGETLLNQLTEMVLAYHGTHPDQSAWFPVAGVVAVSATTA